MPMHRHRSSVRPFFHLFPALSPPPHAPFPPLLYFATAPFLPALSPLSCLHCDVNNSRFCRTRSASARKTSLYGGRQQRCRRPSHPAYGARHPCCRRPSSMLPTAAAHSALHAQPVTTGTQTPQQYTANRRLLCAAPSAIFFTIIHHHTLRETVQKDLSAHFCIKKRIFHTVVSFYLRTFAPAIAPVAELVDALDLGSSFSRSAGSIPVRRTHTGIMYELQRHRKVPQLVHLFL